MGNLAPLVPQKRNRDNDFPPPLYVGGITNNYKWSRIISVLVESEEEKGIYEFDNGPGLT